MVHSGLSIESLEPYYSASALAFLRRLTVFKARNKHLIRPDMLPCWRQGVLEFCLNFAKAHPGRFFDRALLLRHQFFDWIEYQVDIADQDVALFFGMAHVNTTVKDRQIAEGKPTSLVRDWARFEAWWNLQNKHLPEPLFGFGRTVRTISLNSCTPSWACLPFTHYQNMTQAAEGAIYRRLEMVLTHMNGNPIPVKQGGTIIIRFVFIDWLHDGLMQEETLQKSISLIYDMCVDQLIRFHTTIFAPNDKAGVVIKLFCILSDRLNSKNIINMTIVPVTAVENPLFVVTSHASVRPFLDKRGLRMNLLRPLPFLRVTFDRRPHAESS